MAKIKYGIRNVYYALATDDGNGNLTYATPKPLLGAVSMSMSASGEEINEYADNVQWFHQAINNGYTGTLELETIPDSFREECLGEVKDTNGVLFEASDAQIKEFALLWQFEIAGDNTASAITGKRGCFYRCTASRPDVAGATKEANIAAQHETLNLTAMARVSDQLVKSSCDNTSAKYANWFTAVTEKAA